MDGRKQAGRRWRRYGFCLPLLLALAACGADGDFDVATRTNTLAAWESYLRAHPDGRRAGEARAHLAGLREPADWRKAEALATQAGYEQYLHDQAQGEHAREARAAFARLDPGAPPAAVPAVAAATPVGGFRVQLGAFAGGSAAATEAWRRLSAGHPQLQTREPLLTPGNSADGRPLVRLQLGGLDREGAQALCHELAAKGSPCAVITPPDPGAR